MENFEWLEQLSPDGEQKCSRCRKKIHAGIPYWRKTINADSPDEYGANYCTICKEAVEAEREP